MIGVDVVLRLNIIVSNRHSAKNFQLFFNFAECNYQQKN